MTTELARWAAELQQTVLKPTADSPPRIGVEVELLLLDSVAQRPALIVPTDERDVASLTVLRAHSARRGWVEVASEKASVPKFQTRAGGTFTFEPGGQLEYSAPPMPSASALLHHVRQTLDDVRCALQYEGIEALALGVDPFTPIEETELQLTAERYRRMDAHFRSIGPNGARMMRQTASVQICVDSGPHPMARWSLLNAIAPYLAATFANSPAYAGSLSGTASVRRRIWDTLDPHRTGLQGGGENSAYAYAAFALGAAAFLVGPEDASASFVPFGSLDEAHRTPEAFHAHLTTLFPEVRPRSGYFEVRSCDAIPPEWCVAPVVFLCGLVYDATSAAAAREVLGPADVTLLARAGRVGLDDPTLGAGAAALAQLALEGCARLGTAFIAPDDLDLAREFFSRYTFQHRSPASLYTSPVHV